MKVREVISILESQGFRLVRQRGSHRRFEGDVGGQTRMVTVPGAVGEDIPIDTLSAIRRQSGLSRDLFR